MRKRCGADDKHGADECGRENPVVVSVFQKILCLIIVNLKNGLSQGSGTFSAKGVMKPTYFQLYFRGSHIIFFNT